jgi:predicted KAP-like P-loop ATPase
VWKIGKSTYLQQLFPNSLWIVLLQYDTLCYNKQPHLLWEKLSAYPVSLAEKTIIIDEIQKIPELLDEIQ